ncbi:hypothetical protein A3A66_01825 [Microgenomates group bacterium RIFCSPLOWO2_01_FULL_46_13]|nr:MAG: hypothetical protein A3A66_01825 [Microgenomates group bacterium RIFCSPLOWO2_01_FULL_46_13]
MKKWILFFVVLVVGLLFFIYRPKTEKVKPNGLATDFSISLEIDGKETQIIDLHEDEKVQIEEKIDEFEKFKYNKDFVAAIGLFSAPENTEEEGWLDHLLGNDLIMFNDNQPSPRFFNNDKFHLLVGYDIEKIERRENVLYAFVKELRVLNNSEGTVPNYQTQVQDLTFELVNTSDGYQISRYYHAKPTSTNDLKYEGFMAF